MTSGESWALTVGYGVGLALELAGVYHLAFVYLRSSTPGSVVTLLLSALWGGPESKGAAAPGLGPESDAGVQEVNLKALRGLALISVGFIVQAVVTVVTIWQP